MTKDQSYSNNNEFAINYSSTYVYSFVATHSICGIYYGYMENIFNTIGMEIFGQLQGKAHKETLHSY